MKNHPKSPAMLRYLALVVLLAPFLLLAACDTAPDDDAVTFRFDALGETFYARTSDPAVIAAARAELTRPPAARTLHPNGPIRRGDGGYNRGWNWHFTPDAWQLAELSIELCDGRPSYVRDHVDYFVDTVKAYCPWGARLVGEE